MQLSTELLDPLVQYFIVKNDVATFNSLVCEQFGQTGCDDCPLDNGICVRHTPEFTIFVKAHYPELFI